MARIISCTVGLFLITSLFLPASAYATEDLEALSANQLYDRFFTDVKTKVNTAHVNFVSGILFKQYPNNKIPSRLTKKNFDYKDPVAYISAKAEGDIDMTKRGDPSDSRMEIVVERFDKPVNLSTRLEFSSITLDEGTWMKFNTAADTTVRDKWTLIPDKKYLTFKNAISQEGFDLAHVWGALPLEEDIIGVTQGLLKDINLFKYRGKPKKEKIAGQSVIRFDLQYNDSALLEYWRKLEGPGFVFYERSMPRMPWLKSYERIGNVSYLKNFAQNSYISFWFDAKTGLPVKYTQFNAAPTKDQKLLYVSMQHWSWSKVNVPIAPITVPKPLLPYDVVAEAINIPL